MRLISPALAACLLAIAPAFAETPAAPKPPVVSVVPAQMRVLVETAPATGTIVAREEILVTPEIEGQRITEILVEEGDTVRKGQVLARLSSDILDAQLAQNQAAIAQARSQIAEAQANAVEASAGYARTQSLRASGASSQEQLDQRLAATNAAQARLGAAREGLNAAEAQGRELSVRVARTAVKSPSDGLVSRRTAKIGQMASSAAEPLFRIIENGALDLDASIIETRLSKVKIGQKAQIVIGDEKMAGTVRLVSPEVNAASRLGRVRIALDSGSNAKVGNFARAEIETERREGVALPLSALLYSAKGVGIQVIEADRVVARTVKPGLSAAGYMEILEGASAGDKVVLRAGTFLRDGDLVKIASNPGAP